MDSKRAQANPHHDGNLQHDGDVVVLEPKDWTDAEEALSKLAHVASDRRHLKAGADFSAGPRVSEPSLDRTLRSGEPSIAPLPTHRPPAGRRTSHGLARFLVAACVGAAATLVWQSYGTAARLMIASAVPQLGWLLSPPATNPPVDSEIVGAQPNAPAAPASVPQAAPAQAAAVAPTETEAAALTAPTAASPELQQQLETMVQDLAAVRQSVEQLAAGQEQMAHDIAKLHTAGQDIRRRISAVPPAPAATTTARKPVPPPQPAPQASTAPLPLPPPPLQPAPQSSAAPLPAAPSDPPRPPMPVLR